MEEPDNKITAPSDNSHPEELSVNNERIYTPERVVEKITELLKRDEVRVQLVSELAKYNPAIELAALTDATFIQSLDNTRHGRILSTVGTLTLDLINIVDTSARNKIIREASARIAKISNLEYDMKEDDKIESGQ